jgi:serine phosphatase RsbU (regulator of sigma subunit)
MHKIRPLFLIIVLILFAKISVSQYLRPHVENFTQKHYGDSCHSQNWSVTQDNNGLMYFGNEKRALIFDGENWDAIRTSEFGGFVSSMHTDTHGNIYVGSYGQFGHLKKDSIGDLIYVSLSENLENEDAFFSNIWRIYEYQNSILFFASEKIFLLQDNKISIINPKTSFHLAFVVNNQLFVRQRGIGLMAYNKSQFQLIENGEIFKDYGIFGIFPTEEEQKYLIITQELGAYHYDAKKPISKISPINNNSKNELINSNVFGGVILNDGRIALNTNKNGLIIINQNAEIENIINTNTGIKDNDIKQVFQDSNNDIWLAMNTGICRINYSSQISNFTSKSGLTGDISTIAIFNNSLFAGTTEGVFAYNNKTQLFGKDSRLSKQVYQIKPVKNRLVISSELGIYEKNKKNKLTKISNISEAKFHFLNNKELLFVAGNNNIEIYKYQNSNWILKQKKSDVFINNITDVQFNAEINDSLDFWIGTLNEGVLNVKVGKDFGISVQNYYTSDGLYSGWAIPFKTDSSMVFGSVRGLLKLVDLNTLDLESNNRNYKNFFEPTKYLGLETDAVSIFKNTESKIWICKNGNPEYYEKSKEKFESRNFVGIDLGKINTYYIHNSNIFIGGNDGISYVDIEKLKEFDKKINVNIRKITTLDNEKISCSSINSNKTITLDYSRNSITFNFAALYIENGLTAKYSFFIDGYDEKWSDWSVENKITYKRLPPGNYTFQVKAKNIYNVESSIKEFRFKITPPFYRTIFAYIIYIVLFAMIFWLAIKLYTRKLLKDKQRLEEIIQKRTIEIRKQKEEIEVQHKEIKDSINYAQRIQQAVLPSENYLNKILNDYFILFKPKDIVSGDFYWATTINEYVIITAADCTGHGVPGAFMSMLGTSFLNEIVRNAKILKASEILMELRKLIVDALKQTGKEGEQKDGMDISLCTINTKTNEVQWAGANNPLYIVSHNELKIDRCSIKLFESDIKAKLYEVKPDKMPISIYLNMDDFKNKVFHLKKGDKLYMFSDGYVDQFGGEKGKKFMSKSFKKLLLENSDKPMLEQKEILSQAFEKWMENVEQVDDVVVLGIQI